MPHLSDLHLHLHYDGHFSLMVTAEGALAFHSLLVFASGPTSGMSPRHKSLSHFAGALPSTLIRACSIEKAAEKQEAARWLLIKPHPKNSVATLGVSGSLYIVFSERPAKLVNITFEEQ